MTPSIIRTSSESSIQTVVAPIRTEHHIKFTTFIAREMKQKVYNAADLLRSLPIKAGNILGQWRAMYDVDEHYDDPSTDHIRDLEIQIEELKRQLLISLTEVEGISDRMNRDIDNAKQFGISSFAKDLLTVSDNLSRSVIFIPSVHHPSVINHSRFPPKLTVVDVHITSNRTTSPATSHYHNSTTASPRRNLNLLESSNNIV